MELGVDRWQTLKSVFNRALSHDSASRSIFVNEMCANDPDLALEVLSLLRANDTAHGCLDSPIVFSAVSWDTVSHQTNSRSSDSPKATLSGRTISHYRIEEEIGAGGMGVVYRAYDLALGRNAAFKTLSDDFSIPLRQKLLKEADASSRLQHPGIATFYEADDVQGVAFIAMELVQGETVRERLKQGALPIRQAVSVASCLLEALSHAHAAGILHGDIKPENVMLTGARTAKLLDFGLAKPLLAADEGAAPAAPSGRMIAGTVGYMSPEQVRNLAVDARSDLFQVATLLYETLTGLPAFPGATAAERISALLNDSPPPIERVGLPTEIHVILNRALQKDPQERFANAGSFLVALHEASGGEWLDELPDSVVVMDFVNSGASSEDDWIGRGIADTVHTDLSRSYGIEVMRRERMLELRAASGRSLRPSETALALGARWVISGAYQRSGNNLSVNTSLIEASTGRVAVERSIDGEISELFAIQSQIVDAVTRSLRPASPVRRSKEARPSLSAFECYARAQQLFDRRDRGSIGQAGELLMQAVTLEPTYAPALAALAGVHAIRFTYTSDAASLDKAIEYAQRAIRYDPNSAVAFTWLGYGFARKVAVPEARDAWRRAREADPSGFYAYYFDVPVAAFVGAPEEALHLARRAVELSSRSASPLWGLGCLHLTLGQYAEAKWCFLRCIDICARGTGGEGSPGVEGCLGECLRRLRQFEDARRYCLQGVEHAETTDYVYRDTNRVLSLVALGRTALDENDAACAEAAFSQAIAHIHGRNRTLAGGALLVQALAGSARAQQKPDRFDEAIKTFESRASYDFSWYWLCTDDVTCLDLARAAQTLQRHEEAAAYLERACLSGSLEAQDVAPLPPGEGGAERRVRGTHFEQR